MMVSPSDIGVPHLAALGATIPAEGPLGDATVCATCGRTLPAGQPRVPFRPAPTFTDLQYLTTGGRYALCLPCSAYMGNAALMQLKRCVIDAEGVWSLAKDDELAWLFRFTGNGDALPAPPCLPFVAIWTDADSPTAKQHLVWRAAITTDPDFVRVQFGRTSLSIDLPLLGRATAWARTAADIARAAGANVTPNHPYEFLDRKRADPRHGHIRRDIAKLACDNAALRECLEALATIGEGELWALAVTAKANAATLTPTKTSVLATIAAKKGTTHA